MLAYHEPNFSEDIWTPTFRTAGFNQNSNSISTLEKTDGATKLRYKVQSFGPDPQSPYFRASCNSANVQATKKPKSSGSESTGNSGITTPRAVYLGPETGTEQSQIHNLTKITESILKRHKDDVDNLTQKIAQEWLISCI